MGDHEAIQMCIDMAEQAIDLAEEQLMIGMRQEHYNDIEYSEAQSLLNTALMELDKLERIAIPEHKDELYRTKLKVLQLQNKMIITPH
ncbi:MAG: DUF2524 family protein [Bacillaceae bacterium]